MGTVIVSTTYIFSVLSKELVKKNRLGVELNIARDMQMGLMPSGPPMVKGFDVAGTCIPAEEVGGDFYDYFRLDNERGLFSLAVADVSGKAMKAAVTAVLSSGMFRSEVQHGTTPSSVLTAINEAIADRATPNTFVAVNLAALDIGAKKLILASAGQVHPMRLRDKAVSFLKAEGIPLGLMKDIRYEDNEFDLKQGDIIIFYSDGIPEAKNKKQEMYGFERMEKALLGMDVNGPAETLMNRILDEVGSFVGKAKQHDDMTLVVVKVV